MTTTYIPHPPVTLANAPIWWRALVAGLTGITAVGAWFGTWYLTGDAPAREIPFAPPDFLPGGWTFGGFALLVLVAAPMTVACWLAATGHNSAPAAATTAGAVLVAWIAIQVALIGFVFWLQPAMALIGLVVTVLGLWALRPLRQ